MPDQDTNSLNPPEESYRWRGWVTLLVALLLAVGVWYWLPQRSSGTLPVATQAPAPPVAPPAAPEPAPGPENPVEALAPPDETLPELAAADDYAASALQELLGKGKAESLLQLDGFVRRVVATVDNLPREQAPARMWPVNPTAERFTADGAAGTQTIAQGNASRYSGFVQAVEAVDVQSAAAVYARAYPLFQQAYEELGYPGKYFNDRLVAVIDHLLQAPEPEGPVQVTLTEVKGDFPSTRPWVRYEFSDPKLEALSSGQKIMVRVGLANERRLKQRLRALRAAVAAGAVAKARP